MRRFGASYLEETRAGMWEDRSALADLELPTRTRIIDVGCGSGELTHVVAEESEAKLIGLDVDRSLLNHVSVGERLQGEATQIPVVSNAVDLAVCQALLINLPSPADAVREFRRISSELVAAVEPDNSAVSVTSTVSVESRLARRARDAYITGLETDVTLGPNVAEIFRSEGLRDVDTRVYYHTRQIEPPYDDAAVESAAKKVTADRLAAGRDTMLAGDLDRDTFEALRRDWEAMGRSIVEQMRTDTYRRAEVIPFYITVGRVA